ncbi:MAG: Mth938-like domain-containing protein [Gammaproteobacteria bacterium]
MKIELDTNLNQINIINSYSVDGVTIKNTLFQYSIIVSPEQILENWAPENINELNIKHFAKIIEFSPEIVLIGTGNTLRFPDKNILDSMLTKQIGVEVMDNGAACRAYNFLAGEGRIVMAALLKPEMKQVNHN